MFFRRSGSALSLGPLFASALGLLSFSACYEEDVGPHLGTPEPFSNSCLEIKEQADTAQAQPEDLLVLFDCLNQGGILDPVEPPLRYVVASNYLDPYYIVGYMDPLPIQEYLQPGDSSKAVESLNILLNDPSEPLDALLRLYNDLYDQGYVDVLLELAQSYAAFLYGVEDSSATCGTDPEGCRLTALLRLANAMYFDESLSADLALIQASQAEVEAAKDPRVAEDMAWSMEILIKGVTSRESPTGENLIFSMAERFAVEPLSDDPHRSVDDAYVAKGLTMLEAMQQPLCQLLSDTETLASSGGPNQLYLSGQLDYLPLYFETLVYFAPTGMAASTELGDQVDYDSDGYSVAAGDCNDLDPSIYPFAEELTDRKDNDCNLVADQTPAKDDMDKDGVSPNQGDCNDQDAAIHPALSTTDSSGKPLEIPAVPEFYETGLGDLKDNDCDGFTDYLPSSLQLLLATGRALLPLLHESYDASSTNLDHMVELMANSGGAIDPVAALESNEALVNSTLSNLSNGILPADVTARVRATLPVVYVIANMGLLSTSNTGGVTAIYADHVAYEDAYAAATGGQKDLFSAYRNACGSEFDLWVDSLKILDEVVRVLDAWQVLDDPNLEDLLRLVADSQLLYSWVKVVPLSLDEYGRPDADVQAAKQELMAWMLNPSPEDSGLYNDNYRSAPMWTLLPLLKHLWSDARFPNTLDALMVYFLFGKEDPKSPVYALPDAMAALQKVDTGGGFDREAFIQDALQPAAWNILANMLAVPADPNLTYMIQGRYDALPSAVQAEYQSEEGVLEFVDRLIDDGLVSWFTDLAGILVEKAVTSQEQLASDSGDAGEE